MRRAMPSRRRIRVGVSQPAVVAARVVECAAREPRAGGGRTSGDGGTGCDDSCACSLSSADYAARRRAVRSSALRARGLRAISSAVGRRGCGPTGARRGERPHTQTGASGGQMQPRRSCWMKRLTMRSSSEWYEMTARRPSARERVDRTCQRNRQRLELAVDRDSECLEDTRGGMDAPAPARRSGRRARN